MERACLRVRKEEAERARELLRRAGLLDRSFEPSRSGDFVLFPLVREPGASEMAELRRQLGHAELTLADVREREAKRPPSLKELLARSLPPELVERAPRAFDVVGDIAIVEVPPELWPHRQVVGEAIMAIHKRVRLVLAKGGPVAGTFRVRELVPIAGSGPTETTHREHGCTFRLDVARVYFSPRLSYEHARVASQAREGEILVDMFAGVGPFSILAAKKAPGLLAYAIDINPVAVHYLALNVRANKVLGSVVPMLADAGKAIRSALRGVADRVVMNLPERAHEFLGAACEALRPEGGVVHFYTFASAPRPEEEAISALRAGVEGAGRELERVLAVRRVREVAPYRWQVVVDALIA